MGPRSAMAFVAFQSEAAATPTPAVDSAALLDARSADDLSRLGEAHTLAKEQTAALHELSGHVGTLRESARRVGEFATRLRAVQAGLEVATRAAEGFAGDAKGMGELANALAEVRAQAVQMQYDIALAKGTVDRLQVPSEAVAPPLEGYAALLGATLAARLQTPSSAALLCRLPPSVTAGSELTARARCTAAAFL
eukprot:NODE_22561_length_703_cov_4.043403.p3 GENE.NODE_22561_length_703_cov_4.043403~~NODE_22561_length_703_cov_4.043403.p3  ORF type:complete len:195 (-),score=47.62 NODE_22561_length_703_cov_4.043403:40-624(-)